MLPSSALLADLRARIRQLERSTARADKVLPFGIADLDSSLPEGGLLHGALHEICGGGSDAGPSATAALFVAGILARLDQTVLWCTPTADLFGPGLACAGLRPDRVLYARASGDKTVLQVMEEALRHPGLAAVVGELSRVPMTASRRLMLAAEKSGVMALILRRHGSGRLEDHTAIDAATRWRITPLPSPALSVPGMGRARLHVELTRCRGGGARAWIMEACDAQGYLALPAELADRPAASAQRRRA